MTDLEKRAIDLNRLIGDAVGGIRAEALAINRCEVPAGGAALRIVIRCDELAGSLRAIVAALQQAQPEPQGQVPAGMVLVRKEAIDWLNGETDEGFECPPDRYFRGEPPRYWWRSVFREKAGLTTPAAPVQEKGNDNG